MFGLLDPIRQIKASQNPVTDELAKSAQTCRPKSAVSQAEGSPSLRVQSQTFRPRKEPWTADTRRSVSVSRQREVSTCAESGPAEAIDTSREPAGSQIQEAAAGTADGVVRVSLPTSGLLCDVKLAQRSDGRMVISSIEPGCYLEQAGLRPGMLILTIADPIRRGVMWPLDQRSSIRMVRHTLKFQHGRNVEIDIMPSSDDLPPPPRKSTSQKDAAQAGAQQLLPKAAPDRSDAAVRRRQQRRAEYMEQTSGKGNKQLLLVVAAVVLVPPLFILIAALQTGYLDQLSSVYKGKY